MSQISTPQTKYVFINLAEYPAGQAGRMNATDAVCLGIAECRDREEKKHTFPIREKQAER